MRKNHKKNSKNGGNKNNKLLFIFFLILILGTFLRLYDLGGESLWTDEPYSLESARQESISKVISSVAKYEFYVPPLYYISLHYWINLTDTSEFSLRLFSAIFGILSIILIFLVGREFSTEIGLICSFIFSISIPEIVYSQEARSYAMFSFFVLSSTYFFIKLLNTYKLSYLICYLLSSIIMLYILPFGLLVVFLQNIFLLFYLPKYTKLIKKWFYGQITMLLLFLPQLPTFFRMFSSNYMLNFGLLVDKYGVPSIFKSALFTSSILIFIIVLALFMLFYFRKKIHSFIKKASFSKYSNIFILYFLAFVFVYFFALDLLIRPSFITRYTLFLMPILYIIIAFGLSSFKRPFKIIMLIILALVCLRALLIYYPETTKEDWRSAIEYLEKNSNDNSINSSSIILRCSGRMVFPYYYDGKLEVINPLEMNSSDVKSKIDGKDVWMIYSPKHTKKGACEQFVLKRTLLETKMFTDVAVYHYS